MHVKIYHNIIEKFIKPLIFSDDSDAGRRSSVTELLNRVKADDYQLYINNVIEFQQVNRFVAQDKSFRQAFESARTAREVCQNLNFAGVMESTVSQLVQATKAINMQHIRALICDKRY